MWPGPTNELGSHLGGIGLDLTAQRWPQDRPQLIALFQHAPVALGDRGRSAAIVKDHGMAGEQGRG